MGAAPRRARAELTATVGRPGQGRRAGPDGGAGHRDPGRAGSPAAGPLPRRRHPDRRPAAARRRGGEQAVAARRAHRARARSAGFRLRPGRAAPAGRGLPGHLDRALGQGPGMARGAPAAPGRRGGAQRHGPVRRRPGWPRSGGCSTSRSPGPATSCSCTRRCGCTTTGWPRRPARLRAAEPVPRPGGPGRLRSGQRRAAARRCCPAPGRWPRGSTRLSAHCGPADPAVPAQPGGTRRPSAVVRPPLDGEVMHVIDVLPPWTAGIPSVPLTRHLGGFLFHRDEPAESLV